ARAPRVHRRHGRSGRPLRTVSCQRRWLPDHLPAGSFQACAPVGRATAGHKDTQTQRQRLVQSAIRPPGRTNRTLIYYYVGGPWVTLVLGRITVFGICMSYGNQLPPAGERACPPTSPND